MAVVKTLSLQVSDKRPCAMFYTFAVIVAFFSLSLFEAVSTARICSVSEIYVADKTSKPMLLDTLKEKDFLVLKCFREWS